MAKEFNTTVTCDPARHYMVDTTKKMKVFEKLIDGKKYFSITRARQFGKSTSLNWIYDNLSDRYLVVPISFETSDTANWLSTKTFYEYFCENMATIDCNNTSVNEYWADAKKNDVNDFKSFSLVIVDFCKTIGKKVVLTIDEVDKSLDNQLFLNFLSMLRNLYLERERTRKYDTTFWSVILAGVYDIRSMKIKIRPEEDHRYNSPWNVAAEYDLDMTFNPQEISTMLADYENDYHIGFDIKEISEEIYKYTSGYPVLVSSICKIIDESLDRDWTKDGVQKAAKKIIATKTNLSESMISNLAKYPKLKAFIRAVLMENFTIALDVSNPTIDFANMFAIIKANKEGRVEIHNLIFQQILINHFVSESTIEKITFDTGLKVFLDKSGDLNMPMVINRFASIMKKRKATAQFLEREGRFMFICFLKPIINGTGFYYSEPENDDGTRMDLVVTYNRKEYIIELKIWHGTEYEISGRDQISEYLETRHHQEGYLVTFSFLKDKVLQEKPEWIEHNGKKIYEAIIDCGVIED
jgi:hypothetical protein